MRHMHPTTAGDPCFFPFHCPQASGCAGTGPLESYAVRWVDADHAHRTIGAVSEHDAREAAAELLREGALCACVWKRTAGVRP